MRNRGQSKSRDFRFRDVILSWDRLPACRVSAGFRRETTGWKPIPRSSSRPLPAAFFECVARDVFVGCCRRAPDHAARPPSGPSHKPFERFSIDRVRVSRDSDAPVRDLAWSWWPHVGPLGGIDLASRVLSPMSKEGRKPNPQVSFSLPGTIRANPSRLIRCEESDYSATFKTDQGRSEPAWDCPRCRRAGRLPRRGDQRLRVVLWDS
jgi:hypothetical protein